MNDSSLSKKESLYITKKQMTINRTVDRIEFIRLVLEGTGLKPMFDLTKPLKPNEIEEFKNINDVFEKKMFYFNEVLKKFGEKFKYIGSGSTGHTLKIISKPIPEEPDFELNYAVKVVAYPKESQYGDFNNIKRPENAELLMLRILSFFVVNFLTPHIVLPITTFNVKLKTFSTMHKRGFISDKKYDKFVKKINDGVFHDEVSVVISEWADQGDLLQYLRKNYKKLTTKEWRVIFFQIISTLVIIQQVYPDFRHNDLKANNILLETIKKPSNEEEIFAYNIGNEVFYVPDIGIRCKFWDFDFACIPNVVDNMKVSAEWTDNINVRPQGHKYYDVHYFFNTLISPSFLEDFFNKDGGKNKVPTDVINFVNRVIPEKFRTGGKYVSDRGRLLISYEEFKKKRGLFHLDPRAILFNDIFFEKLKGAKT